MMHVLGQPAVCRFIKADEALRTCLTVTLMSLGECTHVIEEFQARGKVGQVIFSSDGAAGAAE